MNNIVYIKKAENYDDILPSDIVLKVYEKSGKTIATMLEIEDMKMMLYTLKSDKNSFDVVMEMLQDNTKVQFRVSFEKAKNNMSGALTIKVQEYDETSMNLELCKFEIEKFKKAKEDMLRVENEGSILLNEASKEEIDEFADQVNENRIELISSF